MGEIAPLRIVITGAAGFLGQATVAAARARGHSVTPIVRSAGEGIAQDLSQDDATGKLAQHIGDADAIIHAASEMSGDWHVHQRSSLPACKTVCDLANKLGAHLVHISSIAIYDCTALSIGDVVSEKSPIEPQPNQRDGYARAKIAQEEIVASRTPSASVLRVGAIFGKGRVMNAHLGIGIGPALLRLASRGQVPLAHVELVAQIAVRAAENKAQGAVNIVDTDLPDRIRFIETLSASGWPRLVIPTPWQAFDILGKLLSFWTSRPGLLHAKTLHARMKPFAYSNELMRAKFVGLEMPAFEILIKRAMRDE